MALDQADLDRVLHALAPVLMLDSCSLLDIIREPMRKDCRVGNVKASMALLQAAETPSKLTVLIADQVSLELRDNLPQVLSSASEAMASYIKQAAHIDRVATEFGAAGSMDTAHLQDHIQRAKSVFDRWIKVAINVQSSPQVPSKAMHRVRHAIAPARRGKENSKDCFVTESYLEAAAQLNAAGFSGLMVFGSSNINEYLDAITNRPPAPLDAHFMAERIVYAPSYQAMKKALLL